MRDTTLERFEKQWQEIMEISPQTMGPFTPLYKSFVRRLKVMPWPLLLLAGALSIGALYALLGPAVTLLASILQRGF